MQVHNQVMKTKRALKKKQKQEENLLIRQQAERIEELREENRNLEQSLESYRKREKEIVSTLEFAKKKSDEYVAMVRVKYALECDRISRFRAKLKAYRTKEELMRGYDEAYAELKEWQNELEQAIARDFGSPMRDYLGERKRLDDDPSLDYGAIIETERTDLENASQITESELKELLEQL